MVATTSDTQCGPDARCLVEIEIAASENITLAKMAPPMHPSVWNGQVGGGIPPLQPSECSVHEGHHRVEVGTRDRAEHQDDGEQASGCRCRVLEELKSDVARRQGLGGNPGADDDGGEQGAPQELGQQASPQHGVPHDDPRIRCVAQQQDVDSGRPPPTVTGTPWIASGMQHVPSPAMPLSEGASASTV